MSRSNEYSSDFPADVLAFVADREAVAKAADWPDMLHLCRIVREKEAENGEPHATNSKLRLDINNVMAVHKRELDRADTAEAERNALRERLDTKTREWMRAQSAFDSEKELHRRTMSELGLARERVAKLESYEGERMQHEGFHTAEIARVVSENRALCERLAKLESAARRACEFYSCEDGCECDGCEIGRGLLTLLDNRAEVPK